MQLRGPNSHNFWLVHGCLGVQQPKSCHIYDLEETRCMVLQTIYKPQGTCFQPMHHLCCGSFVSNRDAVSNMDALTHGYSTHFQFDTSRLLEGEVSLLGLPTGKVHVCTLPGPAFGLRNVSNIHEPVTSLLALQEYRTSLKKPFCFAADSSR